MWKHWGCLFKRRLSMAWMWHFVYHTSPKRKGSSGALPNLCKWESGLWSDANCLREIHTHVLILRNWLTWLWMCGESKICRVGSRLKTQKRFAVEILKWSAGTIPCLPRRSVCVLLRLSTDWMKPSYIMEGNLLYSIYWFKCLLSYEKYLHHNIFGQVLTPWLHQICPQN